MKKHSLRMLMAAVLMTLSVHATADDWRHGSASFALIGDVPYGAAIEAKFDNVISSINAAPHVRFVVHTGDVKGGASVATMRCCKSASSSSRLSAMAWS